MLVGCLAVLIAAAGFQTEVPPLLKAKLTAAEEVRGSFVQTKTSPDGRRYVSRGVYTLRPNVDFEWRTLDPFETRFYATVTNYVYSNEDETVEKPLEKMPGYERFVAAAKGDYSGFFDAFDAKYLEENGKFFVLAKPRDSRLKKVLERVEAEGTVDAFTVRATFPDKTVFEIAVKDDKSAESDTKGVKP